jgi:purine-cytosine permease-like protein
VSWGLSSLIAFMTVNIPGYFVGWLGNLSGGIDLSLVAAISVPAILYPLLLRVFPEPRGVFGPDGPRWVPATDTPLAPVFSERLSA